MNHIHCRGVFVFLLFLILLIPVYRAHADTTVDADITTNTHWTKAESPYILSLPVTVASGATLTIDPGVVVKFDVPAGLDVQGSIKALGTSADPIYFTSIADDTVGGDTNADSADSTPHKGDWDTLLLESPASSLLNNVVERYSDNGLVVFSTPLSSTGFTSDDQVLIFGSVASFANINVPKMNAFDASTVTIAGGNISGVEQFSLASYSGSSLDVSHIDIHNESSQAVGVFDPGSSLRLDTVSIVGLPATTTAISVFGAKLTARNLTITGVASGVHIYDQSGTGGTATITDSSVACSQNGFSVYGSPSDSTPSSLVLSGGTVACGHTGVAAYVGALSVTGAAISGASDAGVVSYDGSANHPSITITKSEISHNGTGIAGYGSLIVASKNSIHDNTTGGFNVDDSVGNLNLGHNFWGDPSGPKHPTLNPAGLGNPVSDNISIAPWLAAWPSTEICCSNVLFLPGIEASRLYEKGTGSGDTRLWEPQVFSGIEDLYMNANGKSSKIIYTKDILDKTTYPVPPSLHLNVEIYQAFIDQMNSLVTAKTINDWKPFAYDWRLKLEDVVNTPTALPNNVTLSLVKSVEDEARTSKTGKVTIITHSNGGLVAKVLVNALVAKGEQGLVDNILMVAAPQLGTPTTIPGLLHGDGVSLGNSIVLSPTSARKFGENMPASYNLLPSAKYFSTVSEPVVNFDSSIGEYGGWRTLYGDSIDTMSELTSFLLGSDGRKKPGQNNVSIPNVLNSTLMTNSITTHTTIDKWVPPSNITLYQVAGWGIDTMSTMTYANTHLFNPVPSRIPLGKNDGDGTVVMASAVATSSPNSYQYYVDLGKYSSDIKIDIQHKNIFQAQPIEDMIKSILNGGSVLSPYISPVKPSDIHGFVTIEMHSPVDINLYDQEGNHTGPVVNPIAGSDLSFVEEAIPGSTYTAYGEDKYITIDPTKQYRLELQGTDQGTFTLQIADNRRGSPVITSFADVPTSESMKGRMTVDVASQDEPTLALDENGDGTTDTTLIPNEPFDPALYFDLLRSTVTSLSLKPKLEKDLLAKVDTVQKKLAKGKVKQVSKTLTNFVARLDLGKGRLKNISEADRQALVDSLNTLLDNLK